MDQRKGNETERYKEKRMGAEKLNGFPKPAEKDKRG
jgi:hypothetical protein